MPEKVIPQNGTTSNDTHTAATQAVQEPVATRRAIITNAHALERVTSQSHGGEHSGDEVTEDEGPGPEVLENDEGMAFD